MKVGSLVMAGHDGMRGFDELYSEGVGGKLGYKGSSSNKLTRLRSPQANKKAREQFEEKVFKEVCVIEERESGEEREAYILLFLEKGCVGEFGWVQSLDSNEVV